MMRYEDPRLQDAVALMHAHVEMSIIYACREKHNEARASIKARWQAAPWIESPLDDTVPHTIESGARRIEQLERMCGSDWYRGMPGQ